MTAALQHLHAPHRGGAASRCSGHRSSGSGLGACAPADLGPQSEPRLARGGLAQAARGRSRRVPPLRSTSTPIAPRSAASSRTGCWPSWPACSPAAATRIRLEGHADERATDLYNLELAAAARPRCEALLRRAGPGATDRHHERVRRGAARRCPRPDRRRGARTAGSRWCSSAIWSPCRPAPTGAGRAAPTSPTCPTAISAARPRPISA